MDKELTIHQYDESKDEEINVSLSKKLLLFLEDHGYVLIKKIGQGAENTAFLAHTAHDCPVTVLISSNFGGNIGSNTDRLESYWKVEKDKKISKYFADIYDELHFNGYYSNDKRYIKLNKDRDIGAFPIIVMEYADFTLDTYLKAYKHTFTQAEKLICEEQVNSFVRKAIKGIIKLKISYTDIKDENIAVFSRHGLVYFKFLDLTTLRPFSVITQGSIPHLYIFGEPPLPVVGIKRVSKH